MTIQVNVQEAKTRLSQILVHAEQGEDVVIARDGKPVARKQSGGAPCGSCCLGWHPGSGGQGVADGVDGSASVVAGADEV
ncbi:MAG: type II toxin-antitoxin system Phd/YefM family antitoxin, partial [Pseudonocardia sp.]